MDRKIDLLANLTLSSEGKRIDLKAEKDEVNIYFQDMSIGQICREFRRLDQLNFLDKFWNIPKEAGLRIFFKYGPFRFRMPGLGLLRAVVRFLGFFTGRRTQ